jgi:hypothetical protein
MSSISRAFTTRRVKMSIDLAEKAKAETNAPQRANTTKATSNPVFRPKISAPLELIHTTNMLSYNAPDIYPRSTTSTTSSAASAKSDDEPDSPATAVSTPPTSPEVSPQQERGRSISPEPNHLSCYFTPPGKAINPPVVEAPIIPKRAPSHTKKASFEAIRRQQSTSRLSKESGTSVSTKASMTFSRVSSASSAASTMSHNSMSHPPKSSSIISSSSYQPIRSREEVSEIHPFGQELAQVTEIAEEYGVKEKLQVIDEEEIELKSKGLCKFSAEDYVSELQGLFSSFFNDNVHTRPTAVWI